MPAVGVVQGGHGDFPTCAPEPKHHSLVYRGGVRHRGARDLSGATQPSGGVSGTCSNAFGVSFYCPFPATCHFTGLGGFRTRGFEAEFSHVASSSPPFSQPLCVYLPYFFLWLSCTVFCLPSVFPSLPLSLFPSFLKRFYLFLDIEEGRETRREA